MKLLSIFCPNLRESSFKQNDEDVPGPKVSNWFSRAAGKLNIGAVTEEAECKCASPFKQAADRLLGRPKQEKKLAVPKSPHHIRKAAHPKKPKHEQIHAADSGSQNPAFTREATKLSFKSNRIREADGVQKSLLPTKFRVGLIVEGLGNFNDAYYYTSEALESAIPLFEGSKIYADHPSAEEEQIRPERTTRDILGHYENVGIEQTSDGCAELCADVDIVESKHTEWARALMMRAIENAEKFPGKDFIGLSINAAGDAEKVEIDQVIADAPEGAKPKLIEAKNNGIDLVKVVRVINSTISCDLVTEAGAGGNIKNVIQGEKSDGKENAKAKGRGTQRKGC